jgi:hypothetical protein
MKSMDYRCDDGKNVELGPHLGIIAELKNPGSKNAGN